MSNKVNYLLLPIVAGALVACGGGGSNGLSTTVSGSSGILSYRVPNSLQPQIKAEKSAKLSSDFADIAHYNGKSYEANDTVYVAENLKLGYSERPYQVQRKGNYSHKKLNLKLKLYNMPYSIVVGVFDASREGFMKNNEITLEERYNSYMGTSGGYHTQELPNMTKATYRGKAFGVNEESLVTLAANFNTKKISGKISQIKGADDITLHETDIQKTAYTNLSNTTSSEWGFKGKATVKTPPESLTVNNGSYQYTGYFYGQNAEEIGGVVETTAKTPDLNQSPAIMVFGAQRIQ